jgi:TM2 domain-containing membrane protein YozV
MTRFQMVFVAPLLLTFICQSYAQFLQTNSYANRPAQIHSNSRRLTAQELLKEETEKIEKHINLVDDALMGITGQGNKRAANSDADLLGLGLPPMPPSMVVQGQVALSQAKPAAAMKRSDATAVSVTQHRQIPEWYQPGNITYGSGTWNDPGTTETKKAVWSKSKVETNENPDVSEQLAEWSYDHGSYTTPHRNKIVLAVIELVPFLGFFGMDRLYLGQPVLAALKAGSFVCTAGVVGGIWALIDAVLVAHNCIEERTEIDKFAMMARFDTNEYELKTAAGIGGLIYLSWTLHICWFCYLLYKRMTRPNLQNYDPEVPPGVMLNPRGDPFFTNVANFKNHAINLKKDPFLQQLPLYEQSQKLTAGAGAHGTLPPTVTGPAGTLGDTLGSTRSNAGGTLRQDEVADFH